MRLGHAVGQCDTWLQRKQACTRLLYDLKFSARGRRLAVGRGDESSIRRICRAARERAIIAVHTGAIFASTKHVSSKHLKISVATLGHFNVDPVTYDENYFRQHTYRIFLHKSRNFSLRFPLFSSFVDLRLAELAPKTNRCAKLQKLTTMG